MVSHVLMFIGLIPTPSDVQGMLERSKFVGIRISYILTLCMFVLGVNFTRVFVIAVDQWHSGDHYTFFFPTRMKIVTEDIRVSAKLDLLRGLGASSTEVTQYKTDEVDSNDSEDSDLENQAAKNAENKN